MYFLFHVQHWSVDCCPIHSVLETQVDSGSTILYLQQLECVDYQLALAQKRNVSLLLNYQLARITQPQPNNSKGGYEMKGNTEYLVGTSSLSHN